MIRTQKVSNMKSEELNVTKIEDIIDIQKANGNINVRQVAFKVPSETDSTISSSMLAKSLETGLSKVKPELNKIKNTKTRSKRRRRKCSLPDITSWPSDSDITVLRMKLSLSNDIKKKTLGSVVPGDGLHQQDSSSMVNLATLILKSQPPSKHSLNLEEYLLPLTSWENSVECDTKHVVNDSDDKNNDFKSECLVIEATCSHHDANYLNSDNSEINELVSTKSKVARFLRLYFCPCCTCLYQMEREQEDPAAYGLKKKNFK